ncbi:MAG: hypothetical protein AAGF12_21240 [Myxococcota bacterium]
MRVDPASVEQELGEDRLINFNLELGSSEAVEVTCTPSSSDATITWSLFPNSPTAQSIDTNGAAFTVTASPAVVHAWGVEGRCDTPGVNAYTCTSPTTNSAPLTVSCIDPNMRDAMVDAGDAGDAAVPPNGVVLFAPQGVFAFDGSNLTMLHPVQRVSVAAEIRSGPGGYLALGGRSSVPVTVVTSSDGVRWTDSSPDIVAEPSLAQHGAVGAGTYVLSIDRAGTFFSTDGGTVWTQATTAPPLDELGLSVAFGDGTFVMSSGARSTDGDTWVAATTPPAFWTEATNPTGRSEIVGYGDGTFVMAATDGIIARVARSTDGGDTWTSGTPPMASTPDIYGIAYGDGVWVVVGERTLWRSTDGLTFENVSAPEIAAFDVAFRPGDGFLLVGERFWSSPDGQTWTAVPVEFPPQVNGFGAVATTL